MRSTPFAYALIWAVTIGGLALLAPVALRMFDAGGFLMLIAALIGLLLVSMVRAAVSLTRDLRNGH